MLDYHYDEGLYEDDDEKFYRETVYNEAYYIEQEQELIRQSNLEIELEEEMQREAEEERKREEVYAQAAREWEGFEKNHPEEATKIVREVNERYEKLSCYPVDRGLQQ